MRGGRAKDQNGVTGDEAASVDSSSLVVMNDVSVDFKRVGLGSRNVVRAVERASLSVTAGEVLGIVGESGCGKSTLARVALGLISPTRGRVLFDGHELHGGRRGRRLRQDMQLVHQDPYASFDPRRRIGYSIKEPLVVHKGGGRQQQETTVRELIRSVGLNERHLLAYPHQLSGGQLQRASIARAYILRPKFVVLDEATASLDVSIRAQVIRLLGTMREEFGTSFLLISHDMGSVHSLADRVAVMYFGQFVELGGYAEVFDSPRHPYTVALVSAVPQAGEADNGQRQRVVLSGEPPEPGSIVTGCAFASRCPLRIALGEPDRCMAEKPRLRQLVSGHYAACHFAEQVP